MTATSTIRDRGVGGAAAIPDRKEDGHTTLFIVLGELIIDLADNVLDLEWTWRDNRHAFDRLKAERPDYYAALVARAAAHKAALRAAGHLTPSSCRRSNALPPPGVTESYFLETR